MLMKGTAARMGVMKRVSLVFKAKANRALDKMEDPRETLDYSYQRQLELLTKVRRGVADVATSRKRVELQMNQLQQQANKLQDQARKALSMGREDLAREALTRKSSAQSQLDDLSTQYAQLQAEEEKLTVASQRLQAKVDAFRTRKETIKATYTAAEAQTRINEAFSGISEEMGDVGMAIQRAEDKTAQMQARAGAIDELMASGALDDVGGRRDDIQSELDIMSANSDVERELAMLKGELTTGAPKQLEGGAQNGASQGPQANQAPQAPQAPQQSQQEQGPYAPQYAPPQQDQQNQQAPQNQAQQAQQQAQPAGLPVSDLPGLQDEPQDGDRS
jgi:phage shock protein A